MTALGGVKLPQEQRETLPEDLEPACFRGLPAKRIHLLLDLGNDVGYAAEICLCRFKP